MKHCTDELLEKYFDGKCGIIRSATASTHIRKCAECRRRLEALKEDRKLLSEIKDVVGHQEDIEKMETEFKGLGRLKELLGDDGKLSKASL